MRPVRNIETYKVIAMHRFFALAVVVGFAATLPAFAIADEAPEIKIRRVPEGGVQPQVAVDAKGRLHLIYLRGKAESADIFYAVSTDGGDTFSKPLRVNSREGSAMAVGSVRGPHLA
ncbi:MAG TPA: sialidase family protein, partial [Pirellulales bacterium]|nr:sialidase family protein [Pirellulales bacterium]